MSLEFYTERIHKAKKEHKCEGCNEIIPIGETYNKQTGKFEHEFFERNLHLKCANTLAEMLDDNRECEFTWEDVPEWWMERKCPKCKNYLFDCSSVSDDCEFYGVKNNCDNITAEGKCKGVDYCSDMTHYLYCDKFKEKGN